MKKIFSGLCVAALCMQAALADPLTEFNARFETLVTSYNQYTDKLGLQKSCYIDFSATVLKKIQNTQPTHEDMNHFIDTERDLAYACVEKVELTSELEQFSHDLNGFLQTYNETWLADFLSTDKMENTEVQMHTLVGSPLAFKTHDPHTIHVFKDPQRRAYIMLMNDRQALIVMNDSFSQSQNSYETDYHFLIKSKTENFKDYLNLPQSEDN